ncbi:type VI secretion system Vgr family protein [Oceanicella sp. SM1341]|uniref:type VI secretion system Vgr family protein n=1 Tax=Oceanicella sp. SM1341 TaxID=1548889 RepID=UPI000E51D170|nr:type VI secretion system tip protein TssI/VgrG [Oceanicella sp. SM1341]
MANDIVLKGRQIRLVLPGTLKGFLMRAQVDETLGRIPETVIEFMSPDLDLDLSRLVGERLRLEIDAPNDRTRYFQGHCIGAEFLGSHLGRGYFRAEVRPWLWFLTRSSDCRIFQDKTVVEVIRAVFAQHGFSDYRDTTKHAYPRREYCVQYHETDFAFVSRLMEEEGIYHYFTHEKEREILVLADDTGAHRPLTDNAEIDFQFREEEYRRRDDHVFEWRAADVVQTGRVALQSYDFEKPKSDLKSVKALPRGRHAHRSHELYAYSGRHLDAATGEHRARVLAEGFAARTRRAHGVCNVRQMAAGGRFRLRKHPRKAENAEYLVVSARHQLQIDSEIQDREMVEAILGPVLAFDRNNTPDAYRCIFEVQPAAEAFRSPPATPRPEIPGLQTAVVVGKAGEEVWTDRHGRVKVQFHWDREGRRDERSSCWVRSSVPWSGRGWGMISVPRIGQEVVVQFEEGDPDRPLITGMVYNGETRPPWALPGAQTQTGLRTNSSKGGAGYNELVFEDRKEAEFVRLRAERDFTQVIGNNAEITVGTEHRKPGTFRQTIHGDKTETIREGNHSFSVEKGEETVSVARRRRTTVGADDLLSVAADRKVDVKGALSARAAQSVAIDAGTTLSLSANASITLTCGGSSIEITPAKITLSAPQVEMAGSATTKISAGGQLRLESQGMAALKGGGMLTLEGGGMTQLKSSGLLMAKGALTMIN